MRTEFIRLTQYASQILEEIKTMIGEQNHLDILLLTRLFCNILLSMAMREASRGSKLLSIQAGKGGENLT
ncbi:MAG: hypothetical protein DRJ51_08865 [Thermoprotei archaeon]|nr:MAG: hypothetical protein DRJ51_08865 [Thermoprotei archaeon]